MRKILILLTMAVGLSACNNDDSSQPANNGEQLPLNIAGSINMLAQGVTRAMNSQWESNDQIGVYITNHNTQAIYTGENDQNGANLLYTFNDGTNYETNGTIYRLFTPPSKFYLSETSVDVYGYYPYSSTLTDAKKIPIDVSTQTSQKAIDLMRARTDNVNNNNAVVELLFQHKLVKLVFNLKQGEDLLDDELKNATYISMTIGNQPTSATYNIFDNTFDITSGSYDIIPVKSESAPEGYVRTFEAIVLPNGTNNAAADRTVTITFYKTYENRVVNTFTIGSGTTFVSGTKYTYNVTVNATSVEVDDNKFAEQW